MTVGKHIIGNWKMNGGLGQVDLFAQIANKTADLAPKNVTVAICPPFTILNHLCNAAKETAVIIGAQDCHNAVNGAHTGDISATMLCEIGAKIVILGHSERRANHDESSDLVAQKATTALAGALKPIICVGETEAQRLSGDAINVVLDQIEKSIPKNCKAEDIIIAYEPVWAIGTGRVASPEDIEEMHFAIRGALAELFENAQIVPILYGGSVNGANASTILAIANVDGALVGGASLKPDDFAAIISAAKNIVG